MNKFKSYNFYISLVSAIMLIVTALSKYFGFEIDPNIVIEIMTGICSVFVVLGIITLPSKKNNNGGESMKNLKLDELMQEFGKIKSEVSTDIQEKISEIEKLIADENSAIIDENLLNSAENVNIIDNKLGNDSVLPDINNNVFEKETYNFIPHTFQETEKEGSIEKVYTSGEVVIEHNFSIDESCNGDCKTDNSLIENCIDGEVESLNNSPENAQRIEGISLNKPVDGEENEGTEHTLNDVKSGTQLNENIDDYDIIDDYIAGEQNEVPTNSTIVDNASEQNEVPTNSTIVDNASEQSEVPTNSTIVDNASEQNEVP
ncbi:MAG: phage holin, partial [Clostridia bacterium]